MIAAAAAVIGRKKNTNLQSVSTPDSNTVPPVNGSSSTGA
jgi:hypothetical protein